MLVKTRGTSSKGFLELHSQMVYECCLEMQSLNLPMLCIKYQLDLCKQVLKHLGLNAL